MNKQTVYIQQPDSPDTKMSATFSINCAMKEEKGVYVLSEQEMLDLLTTTYNAGRSYQYELDRNIPEKEMSSCTQVEWVELKMDGTLGKKIKL